MQPLPVVRYVPPETLLLYAPSCPSCQLNQLKVCVLFWSLRAKLPILPTQPTQGLCLVLVMCRVQLDFSANSCVVLTIFWSRWTVGRSCRSTPGRETDEACLSSGRQECGARTAATGNDTTRKYLVSGARCVLHQSRETSTKATTVSVGF